MDAGSRDDWLHGLLLQQWVVGRESSSLATYIEASRLFAAGLLERVETLTGPQYMLVDGFTLKEARAALSVRTALEAQMRLPGLIWEDHDFSGEGEDD